MVKAQDVRDAFDACGGDGWQGFVAYVKECGLDLNLLGSFSHNDIDAVVDEYLSNKESGDPEADSMLGVPAHTLDGYGEYPPQPCHNPFTPEATLNL
eukprot:gene190-4307_t